jgi:hypothetical protein
MDDLPVPFDLHTALSVFDDSFEDVHDAHVRAVLVALSGRIITPDTARDVLTAMIDIAESLEYGRPDDVGVVG